MATRRRKKVAPQRSEELQTLTPKQSTAITGFGTTYTYKLLRQGVLPRMIIGKRFFIPKSALMRWLDSCGKSK